MSRAAVFLDRDGTLNQCLPDGATTRPPPAPDDVVLVDGAREACDRLRRAGYLLLVVTNQPDVRRGSQTRETVEAINRRVIGTLALDGGATCYHDDGDGCGCRKPKPGLILDLAGRHGVDLGRSWMVGDRPADVAAGRSAGCRTVLVSAAGSSHGYDHHAPSLPAAVDLILAHPPQPGGRNGT